MTLILHSDDLPDSDVVHAENLREGDRTQISTKLVYGKLLSLQVAVCHSGYHSRPHIHNCEQLSYLADGEFWIFVENTPYHLHKGTFMRVPRMAVHWAWNNSDKPCTLYESHCPPNVGNPRVRETAVYRNIIS
jgi:quercetin dioxygenase-like cupin family protein